MAFADPGMFLAFTGKPENALVEVGDFWWFQINWTYLVRCIQFLFTSDSRFLKKTSSSEFKTIVLFYPTHKKYLILKKTYIDLVLYCIRRNIKPIHFQKS